ncbi:hypothetical protein HanOQP8_Chr13g0500191 [Helianthus annuus]|nr:hypothetical protein HanOQP8_Chr13g0500191 [Helianthus annuus]
MLLFRSAIIIINHIKTQQIRNTKFVMTTVSEAAVGFSAPRLVAKKVLAKSQSEGDGAVVRRSIGR